MTIHIKKENKGKLHKKLGVPEGEKIPASKLKIKDSDSPATKKQKQFALNSRHFKHENGGELQGQQIGSALGMAANLILPGSGAILSPLLSQVGGQIGAKRDMTKALQDHYKSMSTSTNPYGNYKNGGELGGAMEGINDFMRYSGPSHENGGIAVNSDGLKINKAGASNEIEGGETIVNLKGKKIVFSKNLKV